MIHKKYDSDCLSIQDAAAVLEKDSSLVSRLFRQGRVTNYQDKNGRKYTTEADLQSYLSSRLPNGFVAIQAEDNLNVH